MTATEHGHHHGRTCYWDHLRCGWVCADPPPAAPAADEDVTGVADALEGVAIATPHVPAESLPA